MSEYMVSLVKEIAEIRGDKPVKDCFIIDALAMIEGGFVEVEKYPTGKPSLKGVYDLAVELSSGANR